MLAVLSGDDGLTSSGAPVAPLRIAVSTKPPVVGTRVADPWKQAAESAAQLLAGAGHEVNTAHLGARWALGTAEDAEGLDHSRLQGRTRGQMRFGRVLQALRLDGDSVPEPWVERIQTFFQDFDVLITPTLAQAPPRSRNWHDRSWLANVWRDANYAPFAARFTWPGRRRPPCRGGPTATVCPSACSWSRGAVVKGC